MSTVTDTRRDTARAVLRTAQATAPTPEVLGLEGAVLGCMLIHPGCIPQVSQILSADDFHHSARRTLFHLLREAHERGAALDIFTAAEQLIRRSNLAAGEATQLVNECVEPTPYVPDAEKYAQDLANAAALRQGIRLGHEIALAFQEAARFDEGLSAAETRLEQLRTRRRAAENVIISAPQLLDMQLPGQRWAVPSLLPEGLTILQAKPKIGKSWMAYQVAIAVASGGVALGKVAVEQGEVLCLMLEDTKRRAQSRIRQLLGSSAPPEGMFLALDWPRMNDGGRENLSTWLRDHPRTRLVIIDTLERFRGVGAPGENAYRADYAAVADIKKIADRYGVSFLIIHHERKPSGKGGEDIQDRTSGSYGIGGAADGTLSLERQRGQKGAVLELTGREVEEAKLAVVFDIHAGGWTLMGEAGEYFQSEAEREVLELLWKRGNRALGPTEAASILGKATGTTKSLLWRMAEKGQLVSSDGAYSLAPRVIAQFHATAATLETAATAATATPTGGDEVAGVAEVAPVARVARVASSGEFSLPEELAFAVPDLSEVPEEEREARLAAWRQQCELRQRVWRLAAAHGWPQVHLDNANDLGPGERPWRKLCHSEGVHPQWLERALKRLEALP